jgi:hypothetical protein
MKKFTVPCSFGGKKAPFNIYIGGASTKRHPLYYQALWLKSVRSGEVPPEVMESFQKLADIAHENNVSFEELVVYALGTASSGESKTSE